MKEYGKVELLFQRGLEGLEAQFGKDHDRTRDCAKSLGICLEGGNAEKLANTEKLAELQRSYPWL